VTAALVLLAAAAGVVAFESDVLVNSLHAAIRSLGIPTIFVGLIIIPLAGNVAENVAAVFFAVRNRLDVTIEIAFGSSTQVALFVAPLLVFVSLIIGRPMDFIFTGFEIALVALAALIVTLVTIDGRTNWLEGVQLVGAYLVVAITSYFLTA
jgi:Ca2+:H+ antiporter